MWCNVKMTILRRRTQKNATRTPENVKTRIKLGIVFEKSTLTGQSEHLREDCSRRAGLRLRKLCRQRIDEFSALPEWECPQIASRSFDRRRTSVSRDQQGTVVHYPVNTDKRVCIVYAQFVCSIHCRPTYEECPSSRRTLCVSSYTTVSMN